MAQSFQTFFAVSAAACALGACAHAGGDLQLGALGDDMPGLALDAPTVTTLASIDTPVSALCTQPAAKAVVDRDLPGLTSRPEYMFFKHMSLRQLQAASSGKMTGADLLKVSADLSSMATADQLLPVAKAHRRTLMLRIASILP